jgi:signal transduction histidine kinase/PAS domain-containing protein/ActR/RegA family two-component response regulator
MQVIHNLDFLNVADKIPVAIFVYQKLPDGTVRVVHTNAYYRSLPIASEERLKNLDQNGLLQLIHPEDQAAVLTFFAGLFKKSGARNGAWELSYRSRAGGSSPDYRWYHASAHPDPQPDGSVLAYVAFTDITAEKETELQALKHKQMYQLIAEQGKQIIFEYDQKHRRVIYQMDSAYTRYLCEAEGMPRIVENVPESLLDLVDAPFRKQFAALFDRPDPGKICPPLEYSSTVKGKTHWWRVISAPVKDAKGQVLTIYCSAQDITAVKKTEEALQAARKKEVEKYQLQLQLMAEANQNFAASYHLNISKNICSNMVVQDQSYAGLKKLAAQGTADGLFAATAATIPDAVFRDKVRTIFTCAHLLQCFASGESKVVLDYPCKSVRGGIRWIRGSVNMVRNPETGDVEGITYAVDIDDQKKNELISRHLAEQEFEYVCILYLQTGMLELVQKKDSLAYPARGEKLSYAQYHQLVEKNFTDPRELEAYEKVTGLERIRQELQARGSYTVSYLHTTEAGNRTCQQLRFSWLDRQQETVLTVQTDATASYEHEEKQIAAIQAALLAAEKANSAKTDFVSRISHDIRTPIGAINNITTFALEDLHDPEKLQEDLRQIQASNKFLLSLVNDVLDISRIDSGRLELHREPASYEELRTSILNMFTPLCAEKKLKLTVLEEPHVPFLLLDKVRYNQLVMNLISNAIKYTPAGGSVTVKAWSERRPDGRCNCYLSVQDTGIGMSKKFQETMFEPFTQEEDNPLRDKTVPGSGLGLSLVKKMVDLVGGHITVHSALGQGTEMLVTLVADEAAADKPAPAAGAQKQDHSRRLQGKLLVAEDNAINTEIVKRILTGFGLTLVHAENGRQALDLFTAAAPGEYAAILMDIQMPILNGYDAAAAIRALPRPDAAMIPIIALTADAFSAAIEHCKAVGMNDYTTKPLHPDTLYQVLTKYL